VLDSLANLVGFPSRSDELARAWAELLGAQNHDTYIVPWVRPAAYSPTIEQKGLQLAG
jgi:hypothetical protein